MSNTPESTRQSEPLYVDWMRSRQQEQHRHQPVLRQRAAKADQSEGCLLYTSDAADE